MRKRKKQLYEKNGYSIYSEDNPSGRLIITQDGDGKGLDSQAIDTIARQLFE